MLGSAFTKQILRSTRTLQQRAFAQHGGAAATSAARIGFVGLGHMGSKMVANFAADGRAVLVFDASTEAVKKTVDAAKANGKNVEAAKSIEDIAASGCEIIFSMLPNDAVVEEISQKLLKGSTKPFTHISCSTISPNAARSLLTTHSNAGKDFISAPVFARPDGIARREAIFMISGSEAGRKMADSYLQLAGRVVDMGAEIGAANVVKLCGNFLIAASIEAIAESMTLAEKNGVDREVVMNLLSSSIFDCLIYKGYGQRVSTRDHRPGGFSLELGLKDVTLVNKAARDANVPMPFLSTLLDRFVSAKAKGRSAFDWSAIGMNVAEDAGIDISKDLERNEKNIRENKTY